MDPIAYRGDSRTTLADAAKEFAADYFGEPRKLRDFQPETGAGILAATFALVGGLRRYRIAYDYAQDAFAISLQEV